MADASPSSADRPGAPATTGHEWDGIREYNNPLPRWWLYGLYATIVWAVGYWIAYPAWPLVADHSRGLLGYSSRAAVLAELAQTRQARALLGQDRLAAAELGAIAADPGLRALAQATGQAAFGDNCAGCHGSAATGRLGYPNLQDDDWLWGGTLEEIARTIRVGIRSGHAETRAGEMPAFGRDGLLTRAEIATVANYVLSWSGRAFAADLSLATGAELFAQNCAACHGEQGRGNPELGAPNLTDAVWLYGAAPPQVTATISGGRAGVMPSWEGRLDTATIKSLAVYLHSLGGGK
ncbi:cytochrome-c oxidase, cbb3-type subunit III [Methylobacterium nodulans]|uniref:Cbb3-type cytochrome c oxidase subunit n=1 Tax=Methylobacterium nodulans (strain LMG 21967 / CNCM I-2342 / ORS 2060) TaxID=460265 RepID=B8IL80_METNO|nr:cytochrome-c oxidase, cbb3-type subunit III [Methylobacterium nodulans]ACL57099.1 cytochrome c oxidase, cbb3-type, subunit III [Methylobacterium nodulans ORS 2060]ACL60079.1 cytochrome c oxidase, cbb3-type, subunit III [Methylobacterium nodulans ORS 2060]